MGFPFKIKKVESEENLDIKFVFSFVLFSFFVLFPVIQFFFRGTPWIPQYTNLLILSGVLFYILCIKKIPLRQLGFSCQYVGNHLMIGLVLGGLILAALPLLDFLISITGLEANELFSEGVKQREVDAGMTLHPLNLLEKVVLLPVSKQFLLTGLIFTGLRIRLNPALAIYGTAVLFTLAHFQINLGIFTLGIITAFLFHVTGTLYASIVFHASCSLAVFILLNVYPRLTTLLVFLFQ